MAALLRRLEHVYIVDDVLPADHVQEWVDYTGDVREWWEVEHRNSTHAALIFPVAVAIIGYTGDSLYTHTYQVVTAKGFDGIQIIRNGALYVLEFRLAGAVRNVSARFFAEWSISSEPTLDVTADPPMRPPVGHFERVATIQLGQKPAYNPTRGSFDLPHNRGGTLVVMGNKA